MVSLVENEYLTSTAPDIRGTARFMAPEVRKIRYDRIPRLTSSHEYLASHRVSPRADVRSLGMALVGLAQYGGGLGEFSWRRVGCNDSQTLLEEHFEILVEELAELPNGRCKVLAAAALVPDLSARSTAKQLVELGPVRATIQARADSTGVGAAGEVVADDSVLLHTPQSIWNRRAGIRLAASKQTTTIWDRRTPEKRCKWAKENGLKVAAEVLADDMFEPEQLVTTSRTQIKAKLRAKKVPGVKQKKILAKLRAQGHGFYYPARIAVERNHMHQLGTLSFDSILGRGSFGEVYKVHDRHTRESYALKICARTHQQQHEYGLNLTSRRDEVEAEFKQMQLVKSESVVNAFAFGELQELGLFWTLSELCLGGELDVRVKAQTIAERGVFEEHVAWRWMKECISGLEHMHAVCVMHNDLKPEVTNVR